MDEPTIFTRTGEEVKFNIERTYTNPSHSNQEITILAFIKDKTNIVFPYRFAGNLDVHFYPRPLDNVDFSEITRKNDFSYDFDLKKINEKDYENHAYSYLSMVEVLYNERRKGVGSAMIDMMEHLVAKYSLEETSAQKGVIRGYFLPFVQGQRYSTEKFYRNNGFEFVKNAKIDLFKEIDPKKIIENSNCEIYDNFPIKDYIEYRGQGYNHEADFFDW